MSKIKLKIFSSFFVLFIFFVFFSNNVFSQSGAQQTNVQQEREKLEKELAELEEQIKKIEGSIDSTKQEIKSRQEKIAVLKKRISQLDLEINRTNIIIKDLDIQIRDTENSIQKTISRIEQERKKLAQIVKSLYQEDRKSLLEIFIAENSASNFFDTLVKLDTLNQKKSEILDVVKNLKNELESQKQKLDTERQDLAVQLKNRSLQKQESEAVKKEQENILKMNEIQYQEYVKQKKLSEQRIAEIRARLFQLAGVPDVEAPTFGEAVKIAQWVQQQTGIRPALLLSVITQESKLARNVGQCYILDDKSGITYHIISKTQYKRGIHPTRDLPIFLQITKDLNKDPFKTPLSCWFDVGRGPDFGWGGAMGPAQFLPSTWIKMVDRIVSITGNGIANPWSVRDSFLAAGLLLRDLGALSNESLAAARYFGASVPFPYSSQVMRRAQCIDNFLENNSLSAECEQIVFLPN
jgi:predicted  nucleic acid-binding Zn-ribbon protein